MSAVISFTVFLICLLILMATRTPVAVALSMVTVAGTAIFVSPSALSQLATSAYSLSSNFILVVVPMFIIGAVVTRHRRQPLENMAVALLTIIGGPGNDTLTVDDTAENDASTGIIAGSTLRGLGMPSVSEVQTIHVQAAAGVYTLRVFDSTIDSTTASTVSGSAWPKRSGPQDITQST